MMHGHTYIKFAFCCLVGAILNILCPRERRGFQSKLGVYSSNQCNLHHSPHTGHLEKKIKNCTIFFGHRVLLVPNNYFSMASCEGVSMPTVALCSDGRAPVWIWVYIPQFRKRWGTGTSCCPHPIGAKWTLIRHKILTSSTDNFALWGNSLFRCTGPRWSS